MLLLIGIFGQSPGPGTASPTGPTTPAPSTTGTTPPPSTPPPPTTAPPASTTTPPTIPETPVVVLNSTDTSGLAARVTEYLAGLGWTTVTPDNFAPELAETTVYYPEGEEAVARLLAAAAPGSADVIAPAIPEVAGDAFTVVLGTDAADWVAPATTPPPTSTTP